MKIVFLVILGLILPPLTASAEQRSYIVEYTVLTVGRGEISHVSDSDGARAQYRMNIDVRVAGLSVYQLDSHQVAVFGADGRLLAARAKADINGDEYAVRIDSTEEGYSVTVNGKEKLIPADAFSLTTLDPLFREPIAGDWLDITYGTIVPYEVGKRPESYTLKRPDGSDELYYDAAGFVKKLTSRIGLGTLTMKRITDVEKGKHKLPALLSESEMELLSTATKKPTE